MPFAESEKAQDSFWVYLPSPQILTHQRACQWVGFVPWVARLTHFTRVLRTPQNGIDIDHRLCVALRLSPHWPCNRRRLRCNVQAVLLAERDCGARRGMAVLYPPRTTGRTSGSLAPHTLALTSIGPGKPADGRCDGEADSERHR